MKCEMRCAQCGIEEETIEGRPFSHSAFALAFLVIFEKIRPSEGFCGVRTRLDSSSFIAAGFEIHQRMTRDD